MSHIENRRIQRKKSRLKSNFHYVFHQIFMLASCILPKIFLIVLVFSRNTFSGGIGTTFTDPDMIINTWTAPYKLIISETCNFCWLKRLSTRRAPGLASQTQWTHQNVLFCVFLDRSILRTAVLVSWRGLHHYSGVIHDLRGNLHYFPSPEGSNDSREHLSLSLALFQSVRLIQMSWKPLWMLNRALQRLSRRWFQSCEWRGRFHGFRVSV